MVIDLNGLDLELEIELELEIDLELGSNFVTEQSKYAFHTCEGNIRSFYKICQSILSPIIHFFTIHCDPILIFIECDVIQS